MGLGLLPSVGPGEPSGDSEGKETRDLAELGVTSDCFLDLERTVPGLCDRVDAVDELLCSSSLCRLGIFALSVTLTVLYTDQTRRGDTQKSGTRYLTRMEGGESG